MSGDSGEGPVSGLENEPGHAKKNARLLFLIISHPAASSRRIPEQVPRSVDVA